MGDTKYRETGRAATTGVIDGRYSLSVGKPDREPRPGWNWTPLSDVARLESGHTPSRRRPEYWNGEIPWIGIRDATGGHGTVLDQTRECVTAEGIANSSARILPRHTVCLSRTASVGYVVAMGCEMATSQDFVNWVCGPELDWRFLLYALLAEHDTFGRFAHGTTHQTIYFPEAKAFHVCMPSIQQQRVIGEILGRLDDRIALCRSQAATLESVAAAIFKSRFVDFDGVTELEESALGLIPVGWSVGTLDDLCGPHNTKPAVAPAAVITLDQMPKASTILNDWKPFGGEKSLRSFEKGDVLFGKLRPYFHKVGVAPVSGACSTEILVLRPQDGAYWGLVLGHASSSAFIEHCVLHSTGTRMPRAEWKDVKAYPIAIPPAEIAAEFTVQVRSIYERTNALVVQLRALTELRDALLPKLVSGELEVPDSLLEIYGGEQPEEAWPVDS